MKEKCELAYQGQGNIEENIIGHFLRGLRPDIRKTVRHMAVPATFEDAIAIAEKEARILLQEKVEEIDHAGRVNAVVLENKIERLERDFRKSIGNQEDQEQWDQQEQDQNENILPLRGQHWQQMPPQGSSYDQRWSLDPPENGWIGPAQPYHEGSWQDHGTEYYRGRGTDRPDDSFWGYYSTPGGYPSQNFYGNNGTYYNSEDNGVQANFAEEPAQQAMMNCTGQNQSSSPSQNQSQNSSQNQSQSQNENGNYVRSLPVCKTQETGPCWPRLWVYWHSVL